MLGRRNLTSEMACLRKERVFSGVWFNWPWPLNCTYFLRKFVRELHNHACLPGHDSALPLEEEEGIA